ncbi:MAG: hypothetical protein IT310_10790 [Anaerolineales bacterium]|nr:hypothetical protein [Anaerolineales bacterium]
MVIKSKSKVKSKTAKTKAAVKSKMTTKLKPVKQKKATSVKLTATRTEKKSATKVKRISGAGESGLPIVRHVVNTYVERRPAAPRATRSQFAYMKAPGMEHAFEVGDHVEVFCDHEKSKERIRGWIKGIVVQVDNKMVAVQFRTNVFLTDGWMVPDRILWYSLTSEFIRQIAGKKTNAKKELLPDY